MKKQLVVLSSCLLWPLYSSAFAAYSDSYSCPSGGSNLLSDGYGFYQCNCTSYAAYKLRGDDISFSNSYRDVRWSHAVFWGGVAKNLGIPVDKNPRPGDIAWWTSGQYGHVAYVESVSSNKKLVTISEYNYSTKLPYRPGKRTISATNPAGYIHFNPNGPGGPTPPIDPPAPGKLPDFITDEVQMADRNGNERYRWKSNETAYVHAYIDNVGNADWEGKKDHIKVSFYLSKGTKVDRHSEWVRIGREEIKKENLKVKKKAKHEYIAFSLNQWTRIGHIVPGNTYNIVVCADRYKDEDNGYGYVKEKHESNNCSTEAIFYVDSIEPPTMPDLTAYSLQLNSGSATFAGGSLYGLTVNMRNAGNGSAESSFQIKYEIKGPSTGGLWKTVGEKSFTAVPFAAGANQQIKTGDDFAAAPVLTGDYLLRACADSKQAVTESNEGNNCSGELAVYVSPASAFSAKPVYRFWSSEQASHFYTISEAEKDRVIAIYTPYQWQYERVEGCALPSQEDDSFPVYRFYSSPLTLHRYTISEEEKTSLLAMPQTFKYEGIAWYAYTYQKEGTVPVYRFYSETYKSHFYTISEAERDLVIEKYPDEMWRYDGIAWYVFECP